MTGDMSARNGGQLDDRSAAACLRAALAAPSIHNSQPWRFQVFHGGFEVHANPDRGLDVIDPGRRAMLISVGAAVFNLRVAVARDGWAPLLREDPYAGAVVARIELGPATEPGRTVQALAAAIPRRRTNRGPYHGPVVPARVVDELRAAAAAEGATLALMDPVRRDAILGLAATADERQRSSREYRRELADWTAGSSERRDGMPARVFGPMDGAGTLPVRDFGLIRSDHRATAQFERHPQLVVLSTRGDGRSQWLRAGQALERVWLTAAIRNVAVQPMTQPLEIPELRRLITDPATGRYPQMILRIGYGLPAAASPRRPWPDVVVDPQSPAGRR